MAESATFVPFGRPPATYIEIPYRDEGRGGGAFYDHFTIQKTTGRETRLSVPAGMTMSALQSYVKGEAISALPYGEMTAEGKKVPPMITAADRVGLLVITGHARETERKRPQALALRDAHERELLRKAFLQGRPVLGICAGSWQIWSSLGGSLKDVKDHAWERMPAITTKGKVGFNTQMHKVAITASSMLAGALTDSQRYATFHPRALPSAATGKWTAGASVPLPSLEMIHPAVGLTVNSVHWKAADLASLPRGIHNRPRVSIAGTALQDDTVAPKCKKEGAGVFKHPDEDTVEVFEQEHGAPLLGIQWHPEAYNNDGSDTSAKHRSIVRYMAKAGDAFCAKRVLVDSFDAEFDDMVSRLRKIKVI